MVCFVSVVASCWGNVVYCLPISVFLKIKTNRNEEKMAVFAQAQYPLCVMLSPALFLTRLLFGREREKTSLGFVRSDFCAACMHVILSSHLLPSFGLSFSKLLSHVIFTTKQFFFKRQRFYTCDWRHDRSNFSFTFNISVVGYLFLSVWSLVSFFSLYFHVGLYLLRFFKSFTQSVTVSLFCSFVRTHSFTRKEKILATFLTRGRELTTSLVFEFVPVCFIF